MTIKKPGFLHIFIIVLVMGLCVRFADFSSAVAEEKKDPPAKEITTGGANVKIEEKDGKATAAVSADAAEGHATTEAEPSAPPEDELNDADIGVLKQLSERRRALDAREKKLDQREALLNAANDELGKKYGELDSVRNEIKKLLDMQSQQEEGRLASLVKVYEGMKPKEAANILNTLDTGVLMQVMGRMSDRKMSPVLAAMDPDRAREVTINLALSKKLPDAPPAAAAPAGGAPTSPTTAIDPAAAGAKAQNAAANAPAQ